MENKVTIKEQLNAIVYAELKGLVKVVDEWFNSQSETKYELVLGTSSNDAPIINLYTEFNDVAQYYVKDIAAAHEGYYLELVPTAFDNFDDENVKAHYLEGDWCNAREFIPGEIDRLTDEVLKAIHPEEECYHFSDEQKAAIKQFNDAMKALSDVNVSLLVDTEEQNFVFANYDGLPSSYLFDGSDGYYQTGYYEHVAEINVKRLPKSDYQYDTDFMGRDGIDLVKEK